MNRAPATTGLAERQRARAPRWRLQTQNELTDVLPTREAAASVVVVVVVGVAAPLR